ncbi:hypothetical protein FDC22_01265 [Clostridium botulinum]|uniref:Uncharacterized protein n=1 Tax=Clostridium botulinum (strain Okra / Type B1) TaxID=498213 RepID=B1IGB0_CLOBK|nr:hypothetical protein [Clostridium botulinum]EKX80456.1 hypothetical protein CFSAN001628_006584 [Clostridium botulinum CFSAN001628]ACA43326.1 hypothetical protein CLD_2441 [Clostridium botulinum B1 str. Okra]MBD5564496.1 hypothetical protein [Clostridium botulinum]MBD5566587.1 hypothetical protein [Clostridium botulinum]MBD5568897.1 hypothetical protein [Clostridium botulinum]
MDKIEMIKLALSSSIVGGLIVAFANFIFSKKLKIRESKLKQLDKILDKQFNAYENILNYFESFKSKIEVDPKEVDNFKEFYKGEVLTYPYFFHDKEIYLDVTFKYRKLRNENEKWLDSKLKLKLFEFETYIFNLDKFIKGINDDNYWRAGVVVENDISYYSDEIIQLCYEFYNKNIFSTKIKFKNKEIYYNNDEINKRLRSMCFYKYKDMIKRF